MKILPQLAWKAQQRDSSISPYTGADFSILTLCFFDCSCMMVPSFFCLHVMRRRCARQREGKRWKGNQHEQRERRTWRRPSWFVFLPSLILRKREAISHTSFTIDLSKLRAILRNVLFVYILTKNKNQIPIRWLQFFCFPSRAKRLSLKIVNLRFALSLLSIIIFLYLKILHRMLSMWNVVTPKTTTLRNALWFFSFFLFFLCDDRCQFTSD